MNVSKAKCGVIAIAGAALAQLAGTSPALAQSSPQVFFVPATPSAPLIASAAGNNNDDRQVITVIEDGTTATITIVNGEVESAAVDGKDIPTDRVRARKDRYELLDKDGDVVATIQRLTTTSGGGTIVTSGGLFNNQNGTVRGVLQPTAPGQTRYRVRAGQSGQAFAPAAPPAPPAPPAPGAHSLMGYATMPDDAGVPKVMIGVNLAEPDHALLGHFGLNPGEVTMFSGVYEGLPADASGIGVYDIVIKVNGQAPAGPEDIRKVLRNLDPGENVKFTILQHGQQRDVSIKVEPYSSERLSEAKVDSITVAGDPFGASPQWIRTGPGAAVFSTNQAINDDQMRKFMLEAEAAAKAGGADRFVARLAPTPGQNADPTVVPLLRLDEMRVKEAQARAQAMEATKRAEVLAQTLADRAAEMDKRSSELKVRTDKNADLEKRLDRLERMLERLLEEKTKDRP